MKYPLYGLDGFPKDYQNNSRSTLNSSLDFMPNSKARIFFMTPCRLFSIMYYNNKLIFVHQQVSLVPNANHLSLFKF